MHPFFSQLASATQKPFLFIGETDHYSTEVLVLRRFVNSREFLEGAVEAGYRSKIIEMSKAAHKNSQGAVAFFKENLGPDCPIATVEACMDKVCRGMKLKEIDALMLKAMVIGDYLGIPIICGDPRTEQDKEKGILAAIADATDILKGGPGTGGAIAANAFARSLDKELMEVFLTQSKFGGVIGYYGAGHFNLGTILETGIPEHQRTIVNLFSSREKALRSTLAVAPDAVGYIVETNEFLPASRNTFPNGTPFQPTVHSKL